MAKKDLVQLRVVRPGSHHIPEGFVRGPKGARKGDAFWTSRTAATNKERTGYVDTGFAEPIGASLPGPQEAPAAGPGETKSSSGEPDGRSTDSQKSGVAGTVQSSFLSRADQVSQPSSSSTSGRGGQAGKAGE